jgi:MinD-like ATPase involved in chromosome partitioning or flagellar assembly
LDIKQLFLVVFGFLALGLMSGIAVAWIKEGIRDEWTNTDEVEQKTGKPVLGSLAWQTNRLPAQSHAFYQSQSDLQRTFDNIAHNLVNRSGLGDKKIISFCSLSPQRQASPVISQLALSLVNAGHKVLLIDADMQFPLRHLDYFDDNTPASSGLDTLIPELNRRLKESTPREQHVFSDLISDSISHIQVNTPTGDIVQLDYISSAFKQERAYDFLASPGFKTLIQYSKEKYDFVLIDTPALPLNFPEMDAVTSLSEGIILLSPYATKRTALIRQIKRLEASGKNNLGILIRNRQTA